MKDGTTETILKRTKSEISSKLDELSDSLAEQIELARRGGVSDVESLAEQADSIMKEIAETGVLESAEFGDKREHLSGLYKQLILMVAVSKEQTGRQIHRINAVLKTLEVYREQGVTKPPVPGAYESL